MRTTKTAAKYISVFSDLHAHNFQRFAKNKNGFNSRLLDVVRALRFINTYNEENDIGVTVFAGDLFNTFSFVENDVMNLVNDVFNSWYGKLYYIVGQHDLKTKATQYDERLATSLVFNDKPNMHLLGPGKVMEMEYTDQKIFGLGWQDPKTFYDQEFMPADIFVGHELIDNPDIPKGMPIRKDWVAKNGYKLLIFGDIHKKSFRKYEGYNVLIPGAPLQHSFGDSDQDRGFWTVDLDKYDANFIPITNTPKFFRVKDISELSSKDDVNFYRVEKPAVSTDTAGMNVMVRKELKHEFRESGLDVSMTDEALLSRYLELKTDEHETKRADYLAVGLRYLKQCQSSAVVPQEYSIKSVEIRNFMSIQGMYKFPIIKDIFLILGNNGFGKTTIGEAIYWGLFGVTTKKLSGNDVVNDVVGEDCAVIVTLEGSKDSISVYRYRKNKELGNTFFFNVQHVGPESEQGYQVKRESADATQEELNQMIGTNASFFKNANYFSQVNFEFFSTLTDAGQKSVCKNLLQLDRHEQAGEKVKFELNILDTKYTKLEQDVSKEKAVLIEKNQTLKNSEAHVVTWNDQHKVDLDKKESQIKEIQEAQKKIDRNVEVLTVEKEDLAAQKAAIVPETEIFCDKYSDAISELEAEMKRAEDKRSFGRQDYLNELKRLGNQKENLNKALSALEADILQINNRLTDIHIQVKDADNAKCSFCSQKLPPIKVSEIRAKLEAENIEKSALLPGMNKSKEDLREKIQKANELMGQLEAGSDFDKQDQAVRVLQAKKDLLVSNLNTDKQAHEKKINELKLDYQNKTSELDQQLAVIENQLSNFVTGSTNNAAALNKLFAEREDLETSTNPFSEEVTRIEGELKALKVKIDTMETELQNIFIDQDIHRFWKVAFSNQGIISYLLDGFAKQFTNTINDVLLDMTNGTYAAILNTQKKLKGKDEYREQFEFRIFIEGKDRNYHALSGGQQARINLATVVTLNRIIQEQYHLSAIPFNLIILDELISELDAEGIEAMKALIDDLAKDCAIYVITHDDKFKNMFDNHVIVDYTKEKGTVIHYAN